MIKAVFFDIDGTLIPFERETFMPSTIKALKKLKEKGIKIIIASGRPWDMVNMLDDMGVPFDGYVLLNGQLCLDQGRVIRGITIPKERLEKAYQFLMKENISTLFATRYKTYHIMEEVDEVSSKFGFDYYDYESLIDEPVYQLMTQIKVEETKKHEKLMAALVDYKGVRWNDYSEDIIHQDGGKSVGLQAMLDYYGLSQQETMAFGDGGNDIDMLEFAGIGVAMGNAKDEVKQHADYITDNDVDDGIYNALIKYKVIEE